MTKTLLSTEEMCPSATSTSTIDTNPNLSTSKQFISRLKCLILAFFLFVGMGNVWGQTYYNMTSGNYSQNFADMANWTNNYAAGSGANNWKVAATATGSTVNAGSVFVSSTTGGVQKGTQSLIILATGTNSSATDLLLNFSGRTAGTLSLDWLKVVNTANTSPRSSDLKIQYSTDGGSNFTDITGYTIPRILNNSTAESGSLSSLTLPAALNNQSTVVLRFYVWHNGQTGGSGNRPKWQLDNISVTSTAAVTNYTVTFNSQGGSMISNGTTTNGGTVSDPGTPTRSGYTFNGWFVASSGGSALSFPYTHGQTADFTLYAQWTANALNVTYDSQGGSSISNGSTTTGGTVSNPGNPTRSGYTFNGWFVASSGGSAISFPYTHNQTTDFTLYAQWIAASSPTLSAATLSSALSTTYGTPSTGISFTASGSNLTGNITSTAQSGYEVSSDNITFSNSVNVLSGSTVYVRFSATQTAGSYNAATAVVLTSFGATAQNITTSGSGNEVTKATPTINSSPTASAITYGQTLASSTLSGGSASVAGSFVFTTPSTAPNGGTANQSVTFTPIDNTNYNTTTTNVSVTVNQANQTITFGALANKTTADAPFSLTATASSGLTVSYSSSNTAVATIVGSTVTIQGAGTTTITASQAGDGNYNAATSVVQTLTVTQAQVTIASWNFFGESSPTTSTADVSNANLTTAPILSRGSGASVSSASNSFRTVGFQNNGISASNTDYFQTSISSSSSVISLSTIDAKFDGTSTFRASPGVTSQFAYSLDGTNFTLIGSPQQSTSLTLTQIDLSGISALQNVAPGTTITFRYYASGQTSTGGWGFNSPSASSGDDGLAIRGQVLINTSPLILVSPNSLSGFSQNSSTPSAEQSYTVSGDNLTNDVTITPPTGFEISTSTGGSFSATNPITLTASGGNLVGEPVTIYVRQSASTLGSVSGNIAHSSTGSNNPNVAVSGTRTGSYYSKSSGNLDEVGTWGINTDGSGSSPSNFSSDGIVYEIRNRTTATIGANWTVTGTASKVLVGDGTNATDFTIPSNYTLTGTIDVSTNAELTIENTTSPTLGTLATNSTLEYNNLAVTLSTAVTYRNLKLTGTGTKTFPGNTVTVSGNLTLDGCTLTGASSFPFSTILLAGNLTYSGAVTPPADANSITLSTNGTASGTQTITGAGNTLRWFRIQTTTANTILLSTTGGSSNLLLGNASGGGLTLVNGSVLNMNGNDFTLFSSAGTTLAFLLNSTGSISATSATDFTLQRTGDENLGTIRFSDGANTIGSLTLNHTGSTDNRLDLGSSLTIADNLVLTAGKLDILGNTLTIGTASNVGTISGTFNNNNYIVAYDNGSGAIGKVQRYVHPTSNTSYSFPIGDNLKYAPITYTKTGGTADAGAYLLVHTKPSKIPQLNSNITNYLNRYWEVEPMGITSPDYSIQFSYESTDIVGPTNSAFIPIKYSNTTWYRPTNTLNTSGTAQGTQVNAGANSLQWDDLTSFSQFSAVADQATALPIELVSFQANCKADNTVSVTWTTASEHNTSHNIVEKSRDGINWSVLGQTAAAGNSTQLLNYEMIDSEKASGTTYYRLTQFDNDGVFEMFDPVSVNCNGATSNNHITTYPNPSLDGFYVSFFTETMEGNGQLTITDASGRPVYGKSVNIQDGNNVFHIGDLNATPGMYYIQVSNGTTTTDIVKHSLR